MVGSWQWFGFATNYQLFRKEPVRNLHEESRAVAGLRVVPRRAAVHEPLQDRHALFNDIVVRLAREVGDHSHAAGIVLVFASIESAALLPIGYVRILLHIGDILAHIVPSPCFQRRCAKTHSPRNISAPQLQFV